MKFVFASDSFKGSLSSENIIELLSKAAKDHFPECEVYGVPVADGGEGTIDAVVAATGGSMEKVMVHGPRMEVVEASYGRVHGDRAVIEMANASGLPMVPVEERNPLYTTTVGTGELIADALNNGYRDISIAIGGSATNDGGMGAMIALGIKFLDESGNELQGFGEDLERVVSIDVSKIHPAVADATFTVMCDVKNPLTGEDGATYTYGRQKGADEEVLERLEEGMKNYSKVIRETLNIDVDTVAGAGAAGGLGAALKVFLNANLKPGIETVLDLIEFDSLLEGANLVITGEGRMDWQSVFGKVPSGVGLRSKEKKVPVIAIVGGMGNGVQNIYDYGISSIIPIVNGPMSLEEAIERAEELYADAADRLFRMLKLALCK